MKKSLQFAAFFFIAIFGVCIAQRAHAEVRVDRAWVKAVAQDLCVPDDAAKAKKNCQGVFDTCMSEFNRHMEGTFYGFCQGQNPELCNKIGFDVYEFSNQGYGMLVQSMMDRFLFTDPVVRDTHACVNEKSDELIPTVPNGDIIKNVPVGFFSQVISKKFIAQDLVAPIEEPVVIVPLDPGIPDPVEKVKLPEAPLPVEPEIPVDPVQPKAPEEPKAPEQPKAPEVVVVKDAPAMDDKAIEVPIQPAANNDADLGAIQMGGGGCSLQVSTAPTTSIQCLIALGSFLVAGFNLTSKRR